MKNLKKQELNELNGGYFAPAGTVLTARDESMRKYATMAANDIFRGFWDTISSLWNN